MTDNSQPPATDSAASFPDDMGQYLQVYIDESEEELEALVGSILELEIDPRRSESLQKSFRMLHSLKGSSGMMGFEMVAHLAHELEDRFERCRAGHFELDRKTTTLVLECIDYFRAFLERLRGGDFSEGDSTPLLNRLREVEAQNRGSSSQPPMAALGTLASSPAIPDLSMTIGSGFRLVVRFRAGLQLADLKARLIVSRLSSIGEIIACDPPVDDAHSFDDLPLFSLTLITTRTLDEVRKIANVDGVASIEVSGGEQIASGPAAGVPATSIAQSSVPQVAIPVARVQPSAKTGVTVVATSRPDEAADIQGMPLKALAAEPDQTSGIASLTSSRDPESATLDARSQTSETLRVEIGRLDDLMNLTGELVVANARFSQISSRMSPLFRGNSVLRKSKELTERLRERFAEAGKKLSDSDPGCDMWKEMSLGLEEDLEALSRQTELWEEGHGHFAAISDAVDQLTRVSKNLQRSVLRTRMVPVGPLFNRFKRVIRDLSVGCQKQIQLSILGEKTELDKRMIDALGDPLLHLVRNSIDHGLESQEQRHASGKPEAGTIFLEAAHRGNNVLIMVRDDGAGINTEKIRARMVDRGLVSELQACEMTEQQVIDYIWHPGFSTAQSVTEISGRGVGMDIVRSAISSLSGTIDVTSIPGEGTTFTIRLPLTLAIIHSLLVRYEDDFFSLPIEDVREIVSIPQSEVQVVHRHVTIKVRGELIPLMGMGAIFETKSAAGSSIGSNTGTSPAGGTVNVVVLHARGKTLGLSVDSLVGRAHLVIKSLSENLYPVRGVSGASILGDGAVCLMLDSATLIEMASERC